MNYSESEFLNDFRKLSPANQEFLIDIIHRAALGELSDSEFEKEIEKRKMQILNSINH